MGRRIGDLSLEELKIYRPALLSRPDDFDAFWKKQLQSIGHIRPAVEIHFRDYPVPSVEVADIEFESWMARY